MRCRVSDFWEMSPPELMSCIAGYYHAEEMQIRRQYEIARMIGMWSIMPHTKKITKPSDLITFDWEEKTVTTVSAEQRAAAIERIRARDAREVIRMEKSEDVR